MRHTSERHTDTADLNGLETASTATLFPSDEETQFGDWVKAGAIKGGDKLSTLNSITSFGPTVEAAIAKGKEEDNQALTVTTTKHHDRAVRVYNLEVESRTGQITHNYLVGDDLVWVHNITSGGVTISSAMGDHGPPHLDVCGCGPKVRIGQNGKPLAGEPELTPAQKKVCKKNKKWIRKKIRQLMRGYKNR